MRHTIVVTAVVLGSGFGGPPAATLAHSPTDVFGTMAAAAAAFPCAPPASPPVPIASDAIVAGSRRDVVFYLAHHHWETTILSSRK